MGADVGVGKEIDKARENKRQNAKNQQQSEVDLPTFRHALRFVQVEVVREKQGENCDADNLQCTIFVDEGNIGIGSNEECDCQQKRTTHQQRFTEKQHQSP